MALKLLIVGRTNRAEAQPLADWIAHALQPADGRQFVDMHEALASLSATVWIPDLIVVLQSHPDEYTGSEIDQFHQFAPLARWVVCCGSWCESEGRTRNLWPLALRVPLRSAASRIQREWQLLCGDNLRPLPMSASREECFDVDHPSGTVQSPTVPFGTMPFEPVDVVVSSPDIEYRRYLLELLTCSGHRVATEPNQNDASNDVALATVVAFDVDPWGERRQAELQDLLRRFPGCSIVGLMNLPSPDEIAELIELGVASVLPKLGDQQRILHGIVDRVG